MTEASRSLRGFRGQPVDMAWLAAFRVLLGLLVSWSALRFLLYGWVDTFFTTPTYFFPFYGFEFLQVAPAPWMHIIFGVLVLLGLMISAGAWYRWACVGSLLLFGYVEMIDVTNYLNHYYLVTLLLTMMCLAPAHRMWSVDAWRKPELRQEHVPDWIHTWFRIQIACVYFWAGMTKFGTDWLLHAQPLNIWLMARQDLPLFGSFFGMWPTALAMSWAGFLFDTTIWAWLLWPRTRKWAYLVVIVFHTLTSMLFNIGLFPFIMVACATVFFEPDWPRRLLRKQAPTTPSISHTPFRGPIAIFIVVWCLIQFTLPLRHLLYPGDVLWDEQGMRWSWKVMVREKNGAITYRVRWKGRERETHVPPTRFLTDHQAREFSGQPDMILRLGHHIGRTYEQRGHKDVEVRVDAVVSLNGRAPALMIDPDVDLMHIQDSLLPASWILPAPQGPPPRLETKRK